MNDLANVPDLSGHQADEPKTLAEAAYRQLRRDIIEGVHRPGEKLRVEHLKDQYAVGAGTLREALQLLVTDALVVAQGQRGFRVAPISLDDFEDITRTRVLLETVALQQSIELGDDTWEANVVASFHMLSRAEEKLVDGTNASREEWELRNRAFHEVLISASTSRWLRHFQNILYLQSERLPAPVAVPSADLPGCAFRAPGHRRCRPLPQLEGSGAHPHRPRPAHPRSRPQAAGRTDQLIGFGQFSRPRGASKTAGFPAVLFCCRPIRKRRSGSAR